MVAASGRAAKLIRVLLCVPVRIPIRILIHRGEWHQTPDSTAR